MVMVIVMTDWLIELLRFILEAPVHDNAVTENKFTELEAIVNTIKTQSLNNAAEILHLKKVNEDVKVENAKYKVNNSDLINRLEIEKKKIKKQE